MFNLTAYTENGTIIVKTLNDYYNDSDTVWDITNYVDTTESNVDVALPYKEVEFKYEGLETKLAKQHQQLSNLSWATEEYRGDDYYDANPETYQIILPFEHMKYERLYDGSSATNAQVGWFVDDNSDPYFGKPLLFYAYNQTSATSIRFLITENAASPNVSGTNFSDITQYIIPTNSLDLDTIESEKNINFRNELNEYTNTNSFEDTLFKVYYQDYIAQVFQNDKRLTTIYAYLPIKMLQEFILADTIAIQDRNYTINEIETDFNTGRSKLELINKIVVSIGGSDPIETTTTIDEDTCTECTADSTFCTVDGTTPTADKTCDVGRSLVISGPTTGQTTDSITLTATPNNFIGTASYLWEGGEAEGETTQSVTITNNTTGNVTYTCTATDSDDNEDFADTHIVVWTPKKYTITLNIVNNITGALAGYNISGNQTGDTLSLEQGQTYSFNTQVTPNSGYEFTTGPTVQNAQGTVGTSNLTVNTGSVHSTSSSSSFLIINLTSSVVSIKCNTVSFSSVTLFLISPKCSGPIKSISSPKSSFIIVAPVNIERSSNVSFLLIPYTGASITFTFILPLTLFIAKADNTCWLTSAIISKDLLFLITCSKTPCIFLMFSISDSTNKTKGLSNSAVLDSLFVTKCIFFKPLL